MLTGDSSIDSKFDASRFKTGIRAAMAMGTPTDVTERVTFQWDSTNTYAVADTKSNPYDWTSAPTATTSAADIPLSLSVRAAVEFFDSKSSSGETSMGDFDIGRIKLIVLDDDWAAVQDINLGRPDTVLVDGNTYTVDYIAPPEALFSVTVYSAFCSAIDES